MHMYFALIISFVNALILCLEGYKFLQILQLTGYHSKGYFEWLRMSGAGYTGRLTMVAILSMACFVVTDTIFNSFSVYFSYLGLIFYVLFSVIFISSVFYSPKKKPLTMTNRMNRAVILLFIVCFAITFGLLVLTENYVPYFRLGGIAFTPLLLSLMVIFVNEIMVPVENLVKRNYVKKAKQKLVKFPDLIKIGITGSFGKTSTKNYLNTILSQKYSVCATPFNYNTPMGITKTVLENLDFGTQVMIAEMGARQRGDIRELCEFVQPQYGILTAIGAQHIATFQNIDNVRLTKAELPAYLGKEGTCVFDMDNDIVRQIEKQSLCKKITVSINDKKADVYADNIKTSITGTTFTLHYNKKSFECSTKLLGTHYISDLLLCVGMALALNLTDEQILAGLSQVRPVEHRLHLINADKDITILDDTYNSSIAGSQRALGVLAMFENSRKIVITPGLVELGTMERLENYNFGKRIAEVADIVVIVNKIHLVSIKQGLLDAGFDETKIYQIDNLYCINDTLKQVLLPGDVMLWENDLPDNYI